MNILFSKLSIIIRKPFVKAVRAKKPKTYIGVNSLFKIKDILVELKAKKVLMVVGGHFVRSGEINPLIEIMNDLNIKYVIYSNVKPDPTFSMVEEARLLGKNADLVIAIGGGSVIDVAKVASALVKNNYPATKMVGMFKANHHNVPLIAVPTTAGTGSEVTVASVISRDDNHLKCQVLDTRIVPKYAILDPILTVSLPLNTSYYTAFDALTHALEAYVSTYADKESETESEEAIKMIIINLDRLKDNLGNLELREELLKASFLAGQAFTRVYIGYVHAFAHALGAKYSISHGLANAMLLIDIMDYYKDTCADKFLKLAKLIDLKSADEFLLKLHSLQAEADIPEKIPGFKKSDVDEIIKLAFRECHGIYPVPKYYNYENAREMLLKLCEDA